MLTGALPHPTLHPQLVPEAQTRVLRSAFFVQFYPAGCPRNSRRGVRPKARLLPATTEPRRTPQIPEPPQEPRGKSEAERPISEGLGGQVYLLGKGDASSPRRERQYAGQGWAKAGSQIPRASGPTGGHPQFQPSMA